jgi:hypothetical protein
MMSNRQSDFREFQALSFAGRYGRRAKGAALVAVTPE